MNALTVAFEGREMHFSSFRGRPCLTSKELGTALGYTDNGFRKAQHNWRNELVEGVDSVVLRGTDLREFLDGLDVSVKLTLSRAPHLTVFF